jgi:hypothetical protein
MLAIDSAAMVPIATQFYLLNNRIIELKIVIIEEKIK